MNFKFSLFFVCFFGNLINLTVLCDQNLSNGDTSYLSFKDEFNLHHAFVIEKLKWASGVISFKVDKNFKAKEIDEILWAMYEIERSSCIRFAAHNPVYGPNYVMIRKDPNPNDCGHAHVGCLNIGEQGLGITTECTGVAVLHELLHTVGFGHHQQRSDRDKYIAIHRENGNLTDEEYLTNFEKKIVYDERIKYLTPFDYESVMLYSEYTFSINELPFMTATKDGEEIRPTSNVLSKYDKVLLNRFYNCESAENMKSIIFYEDEFGLSFPPVVNYHEIARAKFHFAEVDVVVENAIDEDARQSVDDGVTQSEPIHTIEDDFVKINNISEFEMNNLDSK